MRTVILTALIGLAASLVFNEPARSDNETAGIPLIRKKMKEWTRSGSGKTPWTLNTNDTLSCEGVNDTYLYEELLNNGTVHLEWRFVPTAANATKAVRAAVIVRRSGESERCKIALGEDCGTITASAVAASDQLRDFESKAIGSKPKPIGDWNFMDIKMEDSSVSVKVNGVAVSSTIHAKENGLLGLCVEGDAIEFRNIRWIANR